MSPSVSRQSDPDRFEITVEEDVAGVAEFLDRGERRIFFHTEIGDEFGGRGLASTLVGEAVSATRSEGLTIVPVCSYVASWLEKHPGDEDITRKPTPDDLAAVQGRAQG